MSENDTPAAPGAPVPHPFAPELAKRLTPGSRVLLLGVGGGRNVPSLLAAGARVDGLEEDPARAQAAMQRFAGDARVRIARGRYAAPFPFAGGFDAALSTHACLHGSLGDVTAAVAATHGRLRPGAPFWLTLGSKRDPRFQTGRRVGANVAVPESGPERDVPHLYLDEPEIRRLLDGFDIESADEASAADTAGRWAHSEADAAELVHWFVRARRRAPAESRLA